jgi:hypothetical protein
MRRSEAALGATVLALALTAGPAVAEPGAAQTVDDTTGAAQVGAVAVDAPVRVASDGDGESTGATTAGPQTTSESTGAAQVGSVDADVPVRALSDGDDADSNPAGAGAGQQSTGDSTAAAQVGSVDADAPVRVASDGDNTGDGSARAGSAEQSTADSNGAAQVGAADVAVPVRVLSDGHGPDGSGGPAATPQSVGGSTGALQVASPSLFAPVSVLSDSPAGDAGGGTTPELGDPSPVPDGGSPEVSPPAETDGDAPGSPEGLRRLVDNEAPAPDTREAVQFTTTTSDGGGVAEAAEVETLGVADTSLPLTGLGFAALVVAGLWLLASGLALRLVPGGKRR